MNSLKDNLIEDFAVCIYYETVMSKNRYRYKLFVSLYYREYILYYREYILFGKILKNHLNSLTNLVSIQQVKNE
jgi:hypothetical protein